MSPQGMLTRLYFLGIPPGNRENTLLYADIHEDGVASGSPDAVAPNVLQWNPLLVPFRGLAHTGMYFTPPFPLPSLPPIWYSS